MIRAILISLVLLDAVLCTWGFFFPELWYQLFHGAGYVDPQGLLRRCAANWLAFLGVQLVALIRWRAHPGWLLIVAGCRLGDCLTDISRLVFCESITTLGIVAFPLAGVGNLVVAALLIRYHRALAV